jgi:peptide/nickel transport system permease protein
MSAESVGYQPGAEHTAVRQKDLSAFSRVMRYTAFRIVTLFITVVIGVYLTILIANMGGYVDQIQRAQISEDVQQSMRNDPSFKLLSEDEKAQRAAALIRTREERFGLDKPFAIRSFLYLSNALTLNLGWSQNMSSDSGSRQVRLILLERLPPTLLLFGASNVFLFLVSIYMALSLSRRYGSLMDKLTIALAPTSSAPGWFYGLFLIVVFAAFLHFLPYGGMVDAPPPENKLIYSLSLVKHLILPTAAITLSTIFLSAYSWRTFFLIYSSEDYVEMAKAKGLSSRNIESKYILRPTLPTIIANFALTIISLWTGAPILEATFNWPGLGRTLYQAVGLYDTPVIVGSTVIFAYLLTLTIFLLDFVYAMVDPRVKIGESVRRSA